MKSIAEIATALLDLPAYLIPSLGVHPRIPSELEEADHGPCCELRSCWHMGLGKGI